MHFGAEVCVVFASLPNGIVKLVIGADVHGGGGSAGKTEKLVGISVGILGDNAVHVRNGFDVNALLVVGCGGLTVRQGGAVFGHKGEFLRLSGV